MYHLTCPSCEDKTESPFVRNGAVVRCEACDTKYRIKSAHFERELHTGPRTLDETDSVLRSDSVDIDPDEVAPVSIDDEGNVVGLSGLSELMRWSDEQTNVQPSGPSKPARSKRQRDSKADGAPLPEAKPSAGRPKPSPKRTPTGSGRARAKSIKRDRRNKMYMYLGGSGVVLIAVLVIIVASLPGGSSSTEGGNEANTPGPETAGNAPVDPGTKPSDPPVGEPADPPTQPKPPDDVLVFSESYKPSPNPDVKFVQPWNVTHAQTLPTDVPTVLTPAVALVHEDWYISNPPRGAASAAGDRSVELGQVTATSQSDGTTLLTGAVTNSNAKAVVSGELHIMLLDSTGNVFAETYTPLAMIGSKSEQALAMSIPSRYWKRSRGVRASVQVTQWADQMTPLADVQLAAAGQGPAASLRLSVPHRGDKPLRGVAILLTATDSDGALIAGFLVKEQDLYVAEDRWLDLVIATPLPQGSSNAQWQAIVQPN